MGDSSFRILCNMLSWFVVAKSGFEAHGNCLQWLFSPLVDGVATISCWRVWQPDELQYRYPNSLGMDFLATESIAWSILGNVSTFAFQSLSLTQVRADVPHYTLSPQTEFYGPHSHFQVISCTYFDKALFPTPHIKAIFPVRWHIHPLAKRDP